MVDNLEKNTEEELKPNKLGEVTEKFGGCIIILGVFFLFYSLNNGEIFEFKGIAWFVGIVTVGFFFIVLSGIIKLLHKINERMYVKNELKDNE